ncbi:MAG: M20/M25/M40 family metallo-hydrolase [Pirellulales bacterium]
MVNRKRQRDDAALRLVMRLMAIPGGSGDEGRVADFVRQQLVKAGATEDAIESDMAHRKTPLDGQVGNLVLKLPGTVRGARRMLVSHLDTVPICVGCRPVVRGRHVVAADSDTGLGADNRAGVAVLLSTALELLRSKRPHGPLTFLWTVQEEVGLHGARHVRLAMLGRPRLAFNFDGGSPEKLTIGATGGYRMAIEIEGLASHAGGAPEAGVSAIGIASLAIAGLIENGWHGQVRKGRGVGTSNVGVIEGGAATNVVADRVSIRAEARSHDPKFRQTIVSAIEAAFRRAVGKVRSADGKRGKVRIDGQTDYESFRLPLSEPCVEAAAAAVRVTGGEPEFAVANGGLDANWLTVRGIPTVSLGCGQRNIHTVKEQLDVAAFHRARRIAMELVCNV